MKRNEVYEPERQTTSHNYYYTFIKLSIDVYYKMVL